MSDAAHEPLSPKAQAELNLIHDRITALQLEFDSRLLAAALVSRAGSIYGSLRLLKLETPEGVKTVFDYACEQSLKVTGPMPRIINTETTGRA